MAQGCREQNPKVQKQLYERYSGKMMGLCVRYTGHAEDAQDVLAVGFVKVFEKIGQYSGEGSLEGWIRKLMVNEALMYIRKKKKDKVVPVEENQTVYALSTTHAADSDLLHEELLMEYVQRLPDGYRLVFNLYAIEGYNHNEIAEKLDISAGTSKSQLSRARGMLQKWITEETNYAAAYAK